MQIYYPDKSKLNWGHSIWYEYLLEGFKSLGEVILSEKLCGEARHETSFSILPIDIKVSDKVIRVWYDFSDFKEAHFEVMKTGDFYFKITCLKEYMKERKNVYPIGQTTSLMEYFSLVDKLRDARKDKKYQYDIVAVFRVTNYNLRREIVERIRNRKDWLSYTGLAPFRNRPGIPDSLKMLKLPFERHLALQSRSKICVSVPGVGGYFDWCWREAEILGMGGCLLCLRMETAMPGDFDSCHIAIKANLSDLEEKVDYYLKHDEEREEIAQRGLEYFEKWLTPKAMAQNILNKVKSESLLS